MAVVDLSELQRAVDEAIDTIFTLRRENQRLQDELDEVNERYREYRAKDGWDD